MSTNTPTIAIVGSGPSGCYVAQFLQKKWRSAQITIFEALPVPYGLLRYGVAADHQGSKAVIQQFERMFTNGGVVFQGNVRVGRDISLAKLTASFDVVVLATGLNEDAELAIPVQPTAPVVGAGTVLKALNGHPRVELPKQANGAVRDLGTKVAVIGSGNVAIDLLRMIAKSDAQMIGSDICDEVRADLKTHAVTDLTLVSRSCASQAKCDESMLAELIGLPGVRISVTGVGETAGGPIPAMLEAASRSADPQGLSTIAINFVFNAVPQEIEDVGGAAQLTIADRLSDVRRIMQFDTVVTAIGFNNGKSNMSAGDSGGRGGNVIYEVGWLKRGPKGTVAENRKDAKLVAEQIASDFESGVFTAGKLGLSSVTHELPLGVVTYADWCRIDEHEHRTARPGRCRNKLTNVRAMLKVAHEQSAVLCVANSTARVEALA